LVGSWKDDLSDIAEAGLRGDKTILGSCMKGSRSGEVRMIRNRNENVIGWGVYFREGRP